MILYHTYIHTTPLRGNSIQGVHLRIEGESGFVDFDLKNDLNDEEGDSYLPECYAGSVIELQMIKGKAPGDGTRLMEAFLDDPAVKEAKLIFLD